MASFRVEVDRGVRKQIRRLPGNVRQRVVKALGDLRSEPRPSDSEALDIDELGITVPQGFEPRRLRIENWRIVYVVEEDDLLISVLAVRKRPPYRYDDLKRLLDSVLR
jgi:mRNA-degrading endonuclease RelE of RelBE toxin-antitoxin system